MSESEDGGVNENDDYRKMSMIAHYSTCLAIDMTLDELGTGNLPRHEGESIENVEV